MSPPVENLVSRLQAKRSGTGWIAKCPAHEDHEPSLSISEKDGVVLLHCHAGCQQEAVLAALEQLGIPKRDLFPPPLFATAASSSRRRSAAKSPRAFDWQKCVAAFTDKHVAQVAKWRGFSTEFVRELREKGWIGIHNGLVAFPVHNDGKIIGTHFRLEDGRWQYFPIGIKAAPLVFGKLTSGERVNAFESTWDGLDYMDKSGERDGIIITRGASNAKRAAALIPKYSTAFLWTQNDAPDPKTGVKPAETWQQDFVETSTCRIRRVKIPAHDLNDWSRNGATLDDLQSALANAEPIRERPLEPAAAGDVASSLEALPAPVSLDDFYAYMPMHVYIFVPARDLWPAASVNARIPPVPLMRDGKPVPDKNGEPKFISASAWLDQYRPVEQMTWGPGKPMLIEDRLILEGGWIERHGCRTFNLYRPPNIKLGDAKKAGMWFKHLIALYPNDVGHIIRWLAHRVQKPHEKINHALFLGGGQGIGKDTILYPVKHAVGQWNVQEIMPPTLLGRFNGFVKSVLLCINEAHDLGDVDRYALYERLKAYTAAPPDVIRVDEKNLREYSVLNVCGVLLTSNHKTSGLYLPADDRRHYVAWSDTSKDDFDEQYWQEIYAWYDREGCRHVAAYLAQLDISGFNPKSPPPKTEAFWEIVGSNRAPEDAEIADALDQLGDPTVVTKEQVAAVASDEFANWLRDRRNARQIPYRFEEAGYVAVRNPADKSDGRWKIRNKRHVIYAKKTLSKREQLAAARAYAETGRP
jgi:hypothetical protein